MVDPTSAGLIGAGIALSPLANKLAGRALGPAADVVGRHFADKLKRYLARNTSQVMERAAEMVEESGRPAREIPLRVTLPLLEGASREDDPQLQELWAALLANAATDEDRELVPPLFATVLSQLTPLAARVLDVIGDRTHPAHTKRVGPRKGFFVVTSNQLDAHEIMDLLNAAEDDDEEEVPTESVIARDSVDSAIDILVGQGLAERDWTERDNLFSGKSLSGVVRVTFLGQRFLRAVTAPKPAQHGSEVPSDEGE